MTYFTGQYDLLYTYMGQNRPPKQSGREWAFSSQLSLTAHAMLVSKILRENMAVFRISTISSTKLSMNMSTGSRTVPHSILVPGMTVRIYSHLHLLAERPSLFRTGKNGFLPMNFRAETSNHVHPSELYHIVLETVSLVALAVAVHVS